uniref:Uncharacterized protein n=1 Tax=Stegastes partitus TaxID=144197 RepID=A0A3B4Z728_9TELE
MKSRLKEMLLSKTLPVIYINKFFQFFSYVQLHSNQIAGRGICHYTTTQMIPCLVRLGRRGIFQHNNDPKHIPKIKQELLKKKKVKAMTLPNVSPLNTSIPVKNS